MLKYLKNTIFLLFFVLVGTSQLYTWEFKDHEGVATQIDQFLESDLDEAEKVFVDAFMEAYKDFSLQQLGIKDKLSFLHSAFEDVREGFYQGEEILFSAKQHGALVGMVAFKKEPIEGQIYISQLAVDPILWQRGIGKQLVFSILKVLPDTNHFFVIPRRINEKARKFYFGLGFKVSDYMHPGYDPNKYIGYELAIE